MSVNDLGRRVVAIADAEDLPRHFAELEAFLRSEFPGLTGLSQLPAHYDDDRGRTTDPIEHTLEVLALLDTSGLKAGYRRCVRLAVLLHDVGKLDDPYDTDHHRASVELARDPLATMPLSPREVTLILELVDTHDLLGRHLQRRIRAQHAIERLGRIAEILALPHEDVLDLHCRIAFADIGSIRGLEYVVAAGALQRGRRELFDTLAGVAVLPSQAGKPPRLS